MKKRIASILLALVMLLSLLPTMAFATGTSYAITNGSPESAKETNHGYIAIDKSTAAEGETVTITVNPAEGYQLKSLTVTPVAPAATTFKAVYNTTGGANTLTFYYDAEDHSGEGITVYEDGTTNYLFDNSKSKGAKWGYNGIRHSVTSVVIDSTVANYTGLTSTAYMFDDMEYAENISGAEYLDVSQVTNMAYMFSEYGYQSSTLNIVPDVSEWNTGKVTNMSYMFQKYGYKSTALNAVPDVSMWNTVNVTTVTYMFYCYGNYSTALSTVPNMSRWNTGNLTNMASMFSNYGCSSIKLNFTLDLSDWSVASVDITSSAYRKMFESAATKAGKWSVTIPGFTGAQANNETHWYVGDGTATEAYIEPASGKQFTVPAVPTEYTVTFNLNGITGTAPEAQKVAKDGKVTEPDDPTDTVHTFAGWYKTKNEDGTLSDEWNFDNDTVTANMTLYAQWTTKISKIVGTNTGIPTVADFDWDNPATASIPENAWVTDGGNKAFWVSGDNGGFAILHTTVTEEQTIIQAFGLDDSDTFTKVGDTYVLSTLQFTATCTMTDGKFASLTFAGIDLSALEVEDSSIFNGTYTPPKTVNDVLETAGKNAPSDTEYWYGADITKKNTCGINNDSLEFKGTSGLISIPVSASVTAAGDNYTYSTDDGLITFNMTNKVLTSITVSNYQDGNAVLNGEYAIKTVEDVIETAADNFSEGTEWKCGEYPCHVNVNLRQLVIDYNGGSNPYVLADLERRVALEGNNWTCTNAGNVTITFNMTGGALTSIAVSGCEVKDGALNGTYAPSEEECIAAGTMISMPGGKQKAVEELEIGDVICTFDHETGEVSSAPVCFIWERKNVGNAFTLTFEDDIEVTVIEEHGFYDQKEKKYVFINLQNAEEYIGDRFYNADTNSWLELKGCEALKDSVDAYAIITSGDLNHMSNGMLSMCDGSVKVLANIFEYDDQMKFDADKKKADIETYGLTSKEKILEFEGFIESDYDDYNLQYLNVAIGKGLTTWEWIEAFSDYCVENGLVDIYSGSETAEENEAPKMLLMSATAPKNLLGSDPAPTSQDGIEIEAKGDGTYSFTMPDCPVTITAEFEKISIADILATAEDFPIYSSGIPNNAWENSVGSKMYIGNNGLTFGGVSLYNILSKPVTKDGNNYKYISSPYTITFVMDSDKLVKVITEGAAIANNNGEYIPSHTHNPVKVNGQAATETASGWKDYYECACGALFEDKNGTTPIENLATWKAQGGNGYIAPLPTHSGGSTPTVTVPVSGNENSVKVSASVSGSTATVKTITDAELNKVTGGEAVEIDLTGLKKDIDTAKLPTEMVEKIADKDGMSVKLSTATVTFDKAATQEIASQADGSTIQLVVDDIKTVSLNAVQKEAVSKLDTALIIDAYLVSNGVRLCTEGKGGFGGGKASVALPYELKNNRTAANYSVYYVDDAGKLEKLAAKYDAELGAFVFDITHFSNYVVAYDENAMPFADVPAGKYYYDAVKWALENGITEGKKTTLFDPSGSVTRAQVVTFLWRAAGKPVVNYAMNMSDVASGAYYTEAVRWALAEGITKGTDAAHFSPNATCTRGQIVSFLYRYAKATATETSNPFTDVKAGAYYYDAVLWAVENGITGGKTAMTFVPKEPCTRAQVVTFLYRYMGK